MKALSRLKKSFRFLFALGLTAGIFGLVSQRTANAQSVNIDFRFDGQTGAAATTQTLTAGSAGQTFTIDVWATVFGDSTHTNTSQYGLQVVRFRGFSDIVSGGGAFATGAGIGVTGAPPFNPPAADPFFGSANAGTQVKDVGSTTGNGAVGSTTADGIVDFGSNANNSLQDIIIAKTTPVMSSAAGAFGSVNGTGFQFLVSQFAFTTGVASTTAGATTQFAVVKSTNGTNASIVQNGDSSGNTNTNLNATGITVGSPLTFVVGGVVSGNTSVLNMTPPTATINSLAGGTNSVGLNVANTNAASAGTYTGAFSGTSAGATQSPTGTVNVPASGNVTETITYAAPATPTAVPVNFSYTITNTANTSDVQGTGANKTTAFTVDVGGATADNTNSTTTFGPALTGVIAAGGTYRGLSSMVIAASGTGGAGLAGGASIAKILGGSNSTTGNQTMSMAWRTRTLAEKAGTTFDPTLLKPSTGIISDVVNLTGIETAGTTTPPFVLDMSYNPALLPKHNAAGIEQSLANNKLIYLISLNPTTSLWDKAFAENTGNTVVSPTDANYGFQGSFDTFATARFGTTTPTNTQLATLMGAWGVDIANHETWAILDHNSQFAVVPEPSTLMLAGLGLFGLAGLRRRVKKSA